METNARAQPLFFHLLFSQRPCVLKEKELRNLKPRNNQKIINPRFPKKVHQKYWVYLLVMVFWVYKIINLIPFPSRPFYYLKTQDSYRHHHFISLGGYFLSS